MESAQQHFIRLIGRKHISTPLILLLNILTLGVYFVLCRNSIKARIFLTTRASESLADADSVVLKDRHGNTLLFPIKSVPSRATPGLNRYVRNSRVMVLDTPYGRFIFDHQQNRFILPPHAPSRAKRFKEHVQYRAARTPDEESLDLYEKRLIYGGNLHGVATTGIPAIVIDSLCDKFFLWKAVCVVIWLAISYYYYAVVAGLIYLYTFLKGLLHRVRHEYALRKLNLPGTARVFRSGRFQQVSDREIFPGDMVLVEKTDSFMCDAEILKGNVVTDESFITGETVAICKEKGSRVFSGTKILSSTGRSVTINPDEIVRVKSLFRGGRVADEQAAAGVADEQAADGVAAELTSEQASAFASASASAAVAEPTDEVAIALVLRTGKRTKRGFLLRSLLFKKPVRNCFERQSLAIVLWLLASSLLIMAVYFLFLLRRLSLYDNLKFTLDLAISLFSPDLYSSIELGALYVRGQLAQRGVGVSDSPRINTAGEVDMAIFDKTGTLTEEDVDILCIDTIDRQFTALEDLALSADPLDTLRRLVLGTCHSVIELDSQYSGDTLDLKLFLFSNSRIFTRDGKRFIDLDGQSVAEVLHTYDFDPLLKRMSVLVKIHGGEQYLFCKGAPDSLEKVFLEVPPRYRSRVDDYGLQGRRVIAMGYRKVAAHRPAGSTARYPAREEAEKGLVFLGLTAFTNRLKDETRPVIQELRGAGIPTKMCTGDGILTAISVAKDCGMLDRDTPVLFPVMEDSRNVEWLCVAEEDYVFDKIKMSLYSEYNQGTPVEFVVACEGKEFELLRPTQSHGMILERGVVFARFNPDNKKLLVEDYSARGSTTLYCGDGANDTGALVASDVGVSLSSNKASLAAPFTAQSLSGVVILIKEGRSALAMSAAQFKHSFFMQVLQVVQMAVLLIIIAFPSDMMSVVQDLVGIYLLGYSLSNFKASKIISSKKPTVNLFRDSARMIVELLGIFAVTSLASFMLGWPAASSKVRTCSKQGTVLFFTCFFVLVYRTFLLGDFGPYRARRSQNRYFLLMIGLCVLLGTFLAGSLFLRIDWVVSRFEFHPLDSAREYSIAAGCIGISILISFCMSLR